jgi:uncharacterized SAM-binding protein YcdF (DUF218 family)
MPTPEEKTFRRFSPKWADRIVSRFMKLWIIILLLTIALIALPGLYGMIRIRTNFNSDGNNSGQTAILVLGGSDGSRERHAFALAKAFDRLMAQPQTSRNHQPGTRNSSKDGATPDTDPSSQATHLTQRNPIRIWISTGRPRPEISRMSNHSGIGLSRVQLDYRAIDTVTNFTTMAPQMRAANISTVYVVTDVSHIDRAMIIANVVLTYYGIKPIAAPCPNTTHRENEWIIRGWRDYLRCVVWFYTGKSGAHLLALRSFSHKLGYRIQRYNPF